MPLMHARRMVVSGLVVASLSLAGSRARAWNDFGHMEVAAVAYGKLNEKARAQAARLLKLNPRYANWIVGAGRGAPGEQDRQAFMRASTWPDAIRTDKTLRSDTQDAPTAAQQLGYADPFRHEYWHYVDHSFSPDGTPVLPTRAPNAATQIVAFRAALGAAATSDDVKSYDLVWLLHLVGDIHQPLHCASRFHAANPTGDRGGNNVAVVGNTLPVPCDDPRYCPLGPPENLHLFWDDLEGMSYAVAPVLAAAASLPKPDAKQAAVRDVEVWIQEGVDLDKTVVYVPPIGVGVGPFVITPAYQAAAAALAKRRIALAGARLAILLNEALGK
jgi:hypothetical protein